jgi:predicted RNA binding protein YcfA (HicA-like mRNA interferase family)
MAQKERFAPLRKLLESNGWTLARINGSHHFFKKAGKTSLSIPVHGGKVKPRYARQIREAVEEGE